MEKRPFIIDCDTGTDDAIAILAALYTPEALPTIIQTLLQEGYTFVPISQIILTGEYTIDHTGRQCPAA